MNILLLGSGGREHALAWKIAASPLLTKLWCAPGNAGIAREAECVALDIADHAAVIDFCKATQSISSWSARRRRLPPESSTISRLPASRRLGRASRRRSSKAPKALPRTFAREFNIPTGAYGRFTDAADALAYVRAQGAPIVVKADGLAAGKGVVVAMTLAEAEAAIAMMFERRIRRGRRRGRDRGISRRPRDQLLCAMRRRHRDRRWPPRRTTSGCSIMTRDRTPAAWAPIRRRRS